MDDDEAELEEIHNQRLKTNAGTVLNKRRGVQNKGPAKQSSLFGSSETFSIKKATPGYKTPVKPGNTMLRSLIPIVKTPTANEEIEDSDSDDCMDTDAKFEGQSRGNLNPSAWEHSELKNQNIAQQDEHDLSHTRLSNDEEHIESKDATSFVEGQVQPFDRKYQNSKNFENKAAEPDGLSIARKGPSLLMNPGISNDSPAIQHPQFKTKAAGLSSESKSTPMSAQRLFMASHLKSGLLNTVPSSACRPGTTKGKSLHDVAASCFHLHTSLIDRWWILYGHRCFYSVACVKKLADLNISRTLHPFQWS